MIETKKFFSKALAILITAMIVLTGFVPALSFRTYAEQAVVTETTSQKIENFGVFLVSGADNNGTLAQPDFVWTPGSTDEGHQFKYQLDYTFSGEGELVPGTVRITLPKHILKDRNGEIADNWEVAIPEADQVSESDTENQFVFMEQEDSIIIYNRMTLSAAEKGSIQFGYSTSKSIFEYEDMILSLSVPVELNINKSADERLYTTAQIPQVKINTTATLTKATKTFSQFFDSWQDDWGDPAYFDITNSDDYYYLLWLVTSVSNATQPFVLTFNDTVTGDYGDASLVGAKMYGNVGYSTEMTSNPIRSSGHNMYSYVITKHLKETYNPYITYQIRNKINVVLHPIDNIDADSSIVSSAVYTYSEPKPDYPIGSFNFWKYNNYSYYYNYDKYNSNVMNYQLGEFRENNIPDIHEKMVYKLMMQAYSYPWTIEDGYGKTDVDHYGVNKLTYTITDDVFFFADTVTASHNYETKETEYNVPEGTEQLDFHDYEITKVDYQLRITGARWDTEQLRFVTAAPDYSDDDIVYFYAKFGKDTEWREAGRYYLKTGVGESLNNKVTSVTSTGIIFTDNAQCVGYKIVTSNSYYYTNLEAYPFCKIKHSERIDRLVEEVFSSGERKAWLTNIANVRITKSDNADADLQESVLLNKTEFARNYIIGYEKESEIRKKCTYTHNDKVKHIVTLGWQVDVYENYMTQEGVVYVPQESGVFYDLVPAGAEPDLSTVEVKSDSGYLKPSEIDVSTITNYNDTGRTLLVVKIKKRSERGYTMTYSSLHTWESIYDYGALVRNSVAYETGNDNITNGYPDNGGNITESTLLSELDSKTDAKKFLYAEHSRTINILLVVSAGLTKKVKSDTDGTYQRSTAVRLSQDYTYRIRYQTDFVTRSKNMVLFDNLETFSNPDENIYSRWQGMLKRVDVSQLRAIGADPVVYLSNHTVDINDGVFDLTDTATWKKMEDFGDISMARAVAVDLSKDKNGKDFVLESNKSVTVMLHMTAPSSEPDITLPEEEKIAFAYNDVSISARLMSIYSQTFSDDRFITWNYDSVGLKVMGDIPILKLDDSDHSRPVEGISFRLSGVSAYGTEIDSILESDVNGELTFKDIEKGTYELIEYNGSVDYLKINDTFSVTVRSDGTVAVDGTVLEKGVRYKIYDKPRVHVDVSFNKRNLKNKNRRIEGVQFHLYGTSTYGNNINKYAYSNEKGIVSFEDVEMGRYTLKEVSTTQDYILNDNEYVVRIDENGNYEIEGAHRELDGTYTVYNEPYHHFTIQKEGYIEIGGIVLPVAGAKFNLSGSSYLGTEVNMDKTTGINGQATFDHLEAGRYVLYEVEAPEGYVLNTEKYIVTISEDDNITITGSYKNDSGCFVIKNKENSSVTITKKWVDNETNQTREAEPVIHLGVDSTAPVAYFYGNGTDSVLTELAPSYNLRGFAHYDGDADYVKSMIRSGNAAKIDDGSTKCSIYAWYVSDSSAPDYGTVYWWSDANIVYLTNASHRIFSDISSITTIDLSGIDFSLVTDMSYMFHNCSNLKNISFLENLDLSRVTDMSYMFFGCRVLSEVNISCSGTSQLTNTSYMFSDCYQLTDLDVSDFDTSSVTNMSNMFAGCGLTSLDVSGFDTTNVTNMSGMFAGCGGLTSLNVSAFDTANVTDMSYMFSGCNRLTSLDVSGFDTSNVTDMSYMFSRCNRLTSLDVSGFDTTNVTNMSNMFSGCSGLTSLDVSDFDTTNVTNMSGMFSSCSGLTSLDVSGFDTTNVTNMSRMFYQCQGQTSLDVSGFDTTNVTNMSGMFSNCSGLTSLDLNGLDTSSVTNMSDMFSSCSGLKSLDVSGFDTTNVTDMSGMFAGCQGLTSLDVSGFDTTNVTSMSGMFSYCSGLTSLDVTGFNTSKATNMSNMFFFCLNLTSLDVSGFDTSNVTSMSGMFSYCSGLTSLDVTGFNTSNVTNMSNMFSSCSGLTNLDVSGFDTSSVTDMSSMFEQCVRLTSLDLSNFETSKATNMRRMFYNCRYLVNIFVSSGWNTNKVSNSYEMFYNCTSLNNDGKATAYSWSYTDKTYARIYTGSTPGYLRQKTDQEQPIHTEEDAYFVGNGDNSALCLVTDNYKIKAFKPFTGDNDTVQNVINNGTAVRLDDKTTDYKIYAWYVDQSSAEDYGTVYWWSDASNVYLTDKSHRLWWNLSRCIEIDTSGINTSKVTDMSNMFSSCRGLTSLDLNGLDTSSVTNMSGMFSSCKNLTSLDLNGLDTSSVTNMSGMFENCSGLTSLDLNGLDTSNVTDMSYMFSYCNSLTSLDLNGLDTSSVTNMSRMFSYCNNLTSLDIGRLDISSVTNMSGMFYSCSGMTDFSAISNWNVSGVTDMSGMFSYCSGITDLTCFKDWDTSNVTNMEGMFSFQEGLTDISAIGSWNISKVRNMNNMFTYCSALTDLNGLEHWDTRNVITMYGMFGFCRSLSDIHALADWDTSSVTDMGELFSGYVYGWTNTTANRLENVDALRNWDTSHVSNMARMFDHNYYLKNVDGLKNWDVSGVTNMEGMFTSCKSLTSIDGLKNWDVSGVTNMSRMFESCSSLKSADLSKWNPQSPSANMLFSCCNSLITLDVSNWNVGDNFSMCIGCTSLVYVNVSGWTFSGYAHVDSLFSDCRSLRIIDGIEKWKLTKGNLNRLFNNCSSLTELDLSSWDTHGSAMSHMFYGCSNLKTIYVSGLWTNRYESTYVNDDNMFTGCSSLVGGNGTAYNSNNTNWRFACIDTEDTPGYLTFKGTSIDLLYSSTDSNCIVEKVNDNTWTYTFTGLNPNINYYAWEDELENYTSLNMGKENFLMVIDGQGTITNTVKEDPPSFGNLIINKNVLNKDGSEYISSIDKAKRFHFTIILKDSSGAALTDDLLLKTIKPDGSDGILLFTEGKADFTLADDESLMIMDIPAGYLYKVTEEADDNFITTVAGGAAEDTIEADNIKLVSFINKMNYDESEDVTFTIKKEVTGTGIDPNESYSFAVDFSGLRANGLYAIKVNGVTRKSFSASAERKAFVEFDLKANETASITIPENAAYCITERAGNYTSSYRMTDSAGLDLIVRSADSNTNENTDLSTQTETADRGEKISIVFTNTKNVKQKLTLIKEVENASSGNSDSFDFTVILKGLPAKAVIPTSLGRVTADDGGVITAEFVLTAGGIVEFSELPVGTKYEIIEGESDYVASYIVKYGEEEITQGENESPGKELTTREHSIELYKNPTVTFTNRKVSCDITVTKMVDMTYGNLKKGEYSRHEFKFDIIVTGLQGSGKKYSELKGEFKEKDTTGVVQKSLAEIMDLSGEAADEIADTARFTVTLHHGESFKLKGLPYGATYFVTEQANAAYIASYTVSSNEGASLQTAPDGNTVRNKALSLNTEETVDSDDTDIVFVFNNRYEFIPYELPAAGMSDMRVLFAAVLFCMLVCTAVYVLSSQKKEIKR